MSRTVSSFNSSATGVDRQAVARRDVTNDDIDVVALDQIAKLGDDVGGGAGFVDELGLDLGAAEPDPIVRRRHLSGIELINQELGRVVIRNAERRGGRPGEEGHKADLDRRRVFSLRAAGRHQRQGERQTGRENKGPRIDMMGGMMSHGHSLPEVANEFLAPANAILMAVSTDFARPIRERRPPRCA